MAAYLSSLTPVFTRHTYALRESIDVSRPSTKAIGLAAQPQRCCRSPFDIRDVWPSSYSGNTNEILWAAKVGARLPWVTCVVRFVSYECGMDQPTFTPVQRIVEDSGTLFFSLQDLDSTKPAGSVKIRIETIAYYLTQSSASVMERKKQRLTGPGPLI
jgi:predicted nucleotide-binding protein (sugar kinase/HSP70/actin superfamily)